MRGALRRLGFFAFTLRARLTMDFVAPGTGTTRWPATSSMQMPPLLITTALLVAVLTAPGWSYGARQLHAQALGIRNRDFLVAACLGGERRWRIVVFEILPKVTSLILAMFFSSTLYAIVTAAGLQFIGLGGDVVGESGFGTSRMVFRIAQLLGPPPRSSPATWSCGEAVWSRCPPRSCGRFAGGSCRW